MARRPTSQTSLEIKQTARKPSPGKLSTQPGDDFRAVQPLVLPHVRKLVSRFVRQSEALDPAPYPLTTNGSFPAQKSVEAPL